MDRTTVPRSDQPTIAPALVRPTSTAYRLRGRLGRLRLVWRRLAFAAGAGLLAAGLTMAWWAAPSSSERRDPQRTAVDESPFVAGAGEPGSPETPTDRPALGDDQRIVALDRSTIALPVTVGTVVEVIGLRPVGPDVRAEVIAARADVVGVTDEAVLVAVDADAAHQAAEVAAVGRVTILGRERPAG